MNRRTLNRFSNILYPSECKAVNTIDRYGNKWNLRVDVGKFVKKIVIKDK